MKSSAILSLWSCILLRENPILITLVVLVQLLIHKLFNATGFSCLWNFTAGKNDAVLFKFIVFIKNIQYITAPPITTIAHIGSWGIGNFIKKIDI